jgi:hypothetical protein
MRSKTPDFLKNEINIIFSHNFFGEMGDNFLALAQPFINLFLISQLAFHAKMMMKGNSKI